jgi:hypothetical protein
MVEAVDADAFGSLCAPVPAAQFIGLLLRAGFSAEAYRNAWGDLSLRDFNATEIVWQYFRHGLDERRYAPVTLDRDALIELARLPLNDANFKAKLLSELGGHLFDGVRHPFGDALVERWPTIRPLIGAAARPYIVAGDSHTHLSNLTGARDSEWLLPIHLLCTAGSAAGLANPLSRSGYGRHLQQAVQAMRALPGGEETAFLLQFGQVDIEFVYHFRRLRDGRRALDLEDYRAFCRSLLEQYIGFVTDLFPAGRRDRVFLLSVFPPSLSDAAWHQGYTNADIAEQEALGSPAEVSAGIRSLSIANLLERTQIHAGYNGLLWDMCQRHGFRFIDVFNPFLGPDGVVHLRYVAPEAGGAEHHLDSRKTYDIVVERVWQCIDAASGQDHR